MAAIIRSAPLEAGNFVGMHVGISHLCQPLHSPDTNTWRRIKHFRGLATRYDRKPENFLAALKLASIRIWLADK
jgi:transposase